MQVYPFIEAQKEDDPLIESPPQEPQEESQAEVSGVSALVSGNSASKINLKSILKRPTTSFVVM